MLKKQQQQNPQMPFSLIFHFDFLLVTFFCHVELYPYLKLSAAAVYDRLFVQM